jgi:hypothetical protein
VSQAILQIEIGARGVWVQADLDHGDGHVGLNADHRQVGASKASYLAAGAQDVGCERIDHIQGRDVDDDHSGALLGHALVEVSLEFLQLRVVESSVDRGNQILALSHDRHCCWSAHRRLSAAATSATLLSDAPIGGVAAGEGLPDIAPVATPYASKRRRTRDGTMCR